jgi:hypothetical protein
MIDGRPSETLKQRDQKARVLGSSDICSFLIVEEGPKFTAARRDLRKTI